MDVAFKLANVDDSGLLIEFMQEFYELDHVTLDEPAARSAVQQILSNDSFGRVWLMQVDGNPIGYIVLTLGFSLEFQGRDAFIDEIYIRAAHRGRGVGRRAIEFVEGVCCSLGVRALHLEVERENKSAQAMYRKVGFADQDSYLMTKYVAS
jgi:ribosomal protein S18 acetylase RimI-like enzyme